MSRNRLPSTLSPLLQTAIVAAIFGLAASALFVSSVVTRRAASAGVQSTPEPIPSGYFKPTPDQWESLTTTRIKATAFRDVSETDGTIAPADDATTPIFSPFTGRVTSVFVTVGDAVRRGRPLFSGEGGEYAQAMSDLSTAQRTLDAALVQLHVAAANRARLLKLARVDGAARKDVDQSKADLAAAFATVQNDQTAVALVRSRIRVLGIVAANGAGPPRTSVTVRAPIDGIVTQRALGVGQYVESAASGASSPLLTISDLRRVFFVANATESEIGRIHVGDALSVTVPAFPHRVFAARVKYIAPVVDPNSHRIGVRAAVDNRDGALKPGMFGAFTIATGAPSLAVGVPEDAVIFEGDTARVWIVGQNRSLALRYFMAGKTIDGMVEALRGLAPGDRVVTRGSVFIDRAAQGDN